MFLSVFAAVSEDRSPWGNFWFEPLTMRTAAGMRVTPETAMNISAVYACVRVLAETMAMLPFCLYEVGADGSKTPVTDHWLYRLFARQPNRFQNAFEFREMLQGHLALRGNAYCLIKELAGKVVELLPLNPDRVRVEAWGEWDYRYRVRDRSGAEQIYGRGEIWHLRGLSSNGMEGLSPVQVARESFALALSAQDYGNRFFANDAKPSGGWIEFPGSFKDKQARDQFRSSWQEAQAGAARGKMAVLENGMKYHEVGLTNEDAQFLESRQFQVSEIARWFRIPPHMIGDLSRATNNNIEEQSLGFGKYTMTPWAERWEASIENELLPDEAGLEVEFDFANLLRGDAASRSEYYASGITNGWLTRNEARAAENLNPLDGLDEPLRPLNMVEEDEAEDEFEDEEAAEPPDQEATEEDQDAANKKQRRRNKKKAPEDAGARLAAIIEWGAKRSARRIIEKKGQLSETEISLTAARLALPDWKVREWLARPQWTKDTFSEANVVRSLINLASST